jgi:drug/metabolite transporter (DMT)-like permease
MTPANRQGVLATTAAIAFFLGNDTCIKLVSESLPTAQIIFLRGVVAMVVLVLLARFAYGLTDTKAFVAGWKHPAVLWRALVDALATLCYLIALFNMPIGNATAINMAVPLFIACGAAICLHEHLSLWRWLLVLAGFVGVILVIQPRADGFNAYAWLCLVATALHAARDLITRRIPQGISSIVVTMATAIAVTVFAGAFMLVQRWVAMSINQFLLISLAAVLLSAGYLFMVMSMRSGDVSFIAPFRYSALPMALAIGYSVWGDVPNSLAWLGILLLASAGVAMLRSR